MKKVIIFLFCALPLLLCCTCTNEQKNPPKVCNVDNPLTDLPWLKAIVDEIVLDVKNGNPLSVSIYQCIYGSNETGFLVEIGNMNPFYNCSGEILCIMGGVAGETCPELNIVKEKLIWETTKNQKE
ncbi:MAG: hypothetical protein LBC49_01115 [Bacteroidales bacterium]|jgi:hypothetical protein|nr:hypothetical protein [Bacteroidales bacterium]